MFFVERGIFEEGVQNFGGIVMQQSRELVASGGTRVLNIGIGLRGVLVAGRVCGVAGFGHRRFIIALMQGELE